MASSADFFLFLSAKDWRTKAAVCSCLLYTSRAFQDNIGKTSVDVTVERDGVPVELKDVKFPRITSKGDPATEEDAARGELILFSVDFKVYAQKKTVGNVIKTTFADTFSQVKVMYETLYDLVTNKISRCV